MGVPPRVIEPADKHPFISANSVCSSDANALPPCDYDVSYDSNMITVMVTYHQDNMNNNYHE